jgi:peptide/nickel transport system permease protein
MSAIEVPVDPLGGDGNTAGTTILPPLHGSYWRISVARFRSNKAGMIGIALVLLLCLIALTAPFIQSYVTHVGPDDQDLSNLFAQPSATHLLGTDELGRDTLIRLVFGARITLTVAFLTAAFALGLGVTAGLIAGYFGGLIDEVLMRLVDGVLALPAIFLFMLMAIIFRPEPLTLSLIIASVSWGSTARLVRAETLALRSQQHVLAARSIGATNVRIIVYHILPHTLPTVIVAGSLSVGYVILMEAALDFLGLGIQPPTPSWGNMLTNAQAYLFQSPWLVILPGAVILITVASLNIVGNALRDALDPRAWGQ